MTSSFIFEIFKKTFLDPYGITWQEWFPNGRNSVRVILTNKQTLIFRYEDSENWQIETVNSFLKHLKEVSNSKHIM